MSEARFRQEEDRPAIGRVMVVGGIALAAFLVGIFFAYLDEREVEHALGPEPPATRVGQAEVGIVIQAPFNVEAERVVKVGRARRRLASYGWVDRAHRLIHIPIEQAMRDVAREGVR
jgi:hypothetical protein